MSLLTVLAAKEIDKSAQSAFTAITNIQENLNDIKLYLDENKDSLPSNSEVKIDELFILVEKCIKESELVNSDLCSANNWIKGVIEHGR